MILINYKDMSKLINIAIATARIKSISTPHSDIRPFMHLLLYGRIGSGKSTILYEVSKATGIIPLMNLSRPNIVGSVDKTTGNFTPPAIWESRNNVLLIDEFNVGKKSPEREMLKNLLPIMEFPEYKKKIGYRCNEFKEGNKNDLFCFVKNNIIHCKSRFVFFANTMMNINKTQMYELKALCSRCVVIPYYPSIEELQRKARGEPLYVYKKYNPKPTTKIDKKTYNRILTFIESRKIHPEQYLRTIGDLCRAYAVMGFKEDVFDLICDLATTQ